MTVTICSGLIVFPQKLSVLQTGEINCFKSQVDSLWQGRSASSWTGPPPLQHPSGQPPSHRLLSSGVLRQRETEGLGSWWEEGQHWQRHRVRKQLVRRCSFRSSSETARRGRSSLRVSLPNSLPSAQLRGGLWEASLDLSEVPISTEHLRVTATFTHSFNKHQCLLCAKYCLRRVWDTVVSNTHTISSPVKLTMGEEGWRINSR